MKYDICQGCMYFQPRMLTETQSIPKSCNNEALHDLFGPNAGGFVTGTQIISCIYFKMYPPSYGDVCIDIDGRHAVSYILTQPRNFKLVRVPKLYDNSQNIQIKSYETIERKTRPDETDCF